ncbi:Phytochrome-like protein cph1 [compost metagenome]
MKQAFFSKKNIRSILFNLISNGIKFRGELSPVIHIHTSMEDNHVVLTVQDNGRGIHKEGLDRIFDMYGRLHQDVEGRGIGLYLAKKIVNAAGGDINVKSEPGKGSKFTIRFKNVQEQ